MGSNSPHFCLLAAKNTPPGGFLTVFEVIFWPRGVDFGEIIGSFEKLLARKPDLGFKLEPLYLKLRQAPQAFCHFWAL